MFGIKLELKSVATLAKPQVADYIPHTVYTALTQLTSQGG